MTVDKVPLQPDKHATGSTLNEWVAAVTRSVRKIHDNIGDTHSLPDLAESALLSPFHFHRVFRQLTGSTPGRFVAASRMAEAKRLLAYSQMSVTDICMEVGYSSMGTFTTQFTRLVGVSPLRFRRLMTVFANQSFSAVLTRLRAVLPGPIGRQVTGLMTGGADGGAMAVVGLFRTGIPQERPSACAILLVPGRAAFDGLTDGEYHPLAMSCDPSVTVVEAMARDDSAGCFVGASPTPVQISKGCPVAGATFQIALRPREPIDPPLVLALPLLVAAEVLCSSAQASTQASTR
jgi:AraC family transcriptional regulator